VAAVFSGKIEFLEQDGRSNFAKSGFFITKNHQCWKLSCILDENEPIKAHRDIVLHCFGRADAPKRLFIFQTQTVWQMALIYRILIIKY
jgi:hypothetical protein